MLSVILKQSIDIIFGHVMSYLRHREMIPIWRLIGTTSFYSNLNFRDLLWHIQIYYYNGNAVRDRDAIHSFSAKYRSIQQTTITNNFRMIFLQIEYPYALWRAYLHAIS